MSAVSSVGSIIQGNSAAEAGEYNAQIDDFNAAQEENNGKIAVQQQQQHANKIIGQAKAAYGASGVSSDEGSAADVIASSATQSAMDAINLQRSYDAKAIGYKMSGDLARKQGAAAQTASYFTAAGQLLGSAKDIEAIGGL